MKLELTEREFEVILDALKSYERDKIIVCGIQKGDRAANTALLIVEIVSLKNKLVKTHCG